jgi:hypothetical protein
MTFPAVAGRAALMFLFFGFCGADDALDLEPEVSAHLLD